MKVGKKFGRVWKLFYDNNGQFMLARVLERTTFWNFPQFSSKREKKREKKIIVYYDFFSL